MSTPSRMTVIPRRAHSARNSAWRTSSPGARVQPSPYTATVGAVDKTRLRLKLINCVASSEATPERLRYRLYRWCGLISRARRIEPGFKVYYPGRVELGTNSYINRDCLIENSGGAWVRIGENCDIAMRVSLIAASHEIGGPARRAGSETKRDVVVGRGSWIGAGAIVLGGVTIGEGCIVAAGAVVTADCQPNGLYAGVPARRVRDLPAK